MIGIIDYGMGNLRSVQKAFEHLGVEAVVGQKPSDLAGSTHVVLPGVGAFRDAITELHRHDFVSFIRDTVESDRPMLGICLGLQLLFDVSYEDGTFEGLGIVPGEVVRFDPEPDLKIPHMGWNALEVRNENRLTEGLGEDSQVYFVHSYYVCPKLEEVIATETEHGSQRFTSMIARGQLFATQFHPEKSQGVGLQLLKNFANLESVPS